MWVKLCTNMLSPGRIPIICQSTPFSLYDKYDWRYGSLEKKEEFKLTGPNQYLPLTRTTYLYDASSFMKETMTSSQVFKKG